MIVWYSSLLFSITDRQFLDISNVPENRSFFDDMHPLSNFLTMTRHARQCSCPHIMNHQLSHDWVKFTFILIFSPHLFHFTCFSLGLLGRLNRKIILRFPLMSLRLQGVLKPVVGDNLHRFQFESGLDYEASPL